MNNNATNQSDAANGGHRASAGNTANSRLERRRPGRQAITNPYLIALLRNAGEIVQTPQTARLMPLDGSLREFQGLAIETPLLADTISLIDGASQVGTPQHRPAQPGASAGDDADRYLDSRYLENQVHYVAGVSLATMRGAVPVEHLCVGDVVLTHGGRRQVTWIGRFDFDPATSPEPGNAMPVLVQQGALGAGLPSQDLLVAPGHCLWIAGRIIPVRLLTNNLSIWQLSGARQVTYFHVLYDKPAVGRLVATASSAAPFWRRLLARVNVGTNLQLLADGRMVTATDSQNNRRMFVVPPGTRVVHLVSSATTAVNRIEIESNGDRVVIPADDPGLKAGWDGIERHGSARWRIMRGLAEVPVEAQDGPAFLTVYLHRLRGVAS